MGEDQEEESSESQQGDHYDTPGALKAASASSSMSTSAIAKEVISEDREEESSESQQSDHYDTPGALKAASASSSMSTSAIAEESIRPWDHKSTKTFLTVPDITTRVRPKMSRKRVSVKKLTSESSLK